MANRSVTDEHGASSTTTLTITVTGTNDAPVAVADTNSGVEHASLLHCTVTINCSLPPSRASRLDRRDGQPLRHRRTRCELDDHAHHYGDRHQRHAGCGCRHQFRGRARLASALHGHHQLQPTTISRIETRPT